MISYIERTIKSQSARDPLINLLNAKRVEGDLPLGGGLSERPREVHDTISVGVEGVEGVEGVFRIAGGVSAVFRGWFCTHPLRRHPEVARVTGPTHHTHHSPGAGGLQGKVMKKLPCSIHIFSPLCLRGLPRGILLNFFFNLKEFAGRLECP